MPAVEKAGPYAPDDNPNAFPRHLDKSVILSASEGPLFPSRDRHPDDSNAAVTVMLCHPDRSEAKCKYVLSHPAKSLFRNPRNPIQLKR